MNRNRRIYLKDNFSKMSRGFHQLVGLTYLFKGENLIHQRNDLAVSQKIHHIRGKPCNDLAFFFWRPRPEHGARV